MKIFVLTLFVLLVCYSTAQLASSHVRACNMSSECGADHCCKSLTRPRGKRAIYGYSGTCQPMGQAKQACLVNYGQYDASKVYYVNCPCETGLTCAPSGDTDQPLGPMGFCA